MSAPSFLLQLWLLGSESYPALTFVVSAAVKSTAIVLLAASLALLLRRRPALMRLWMWRGCLGVLASLLLWAVAPQVLERWRMTVSVEPGPVLHSVIQEAQEREWLSKDGPGGPAGQPVPAWLPAPHAPLRAYPSAGGGTTEQPQVMLSFMRMPWLARVEGAVLGIWWGVALLLFGVRVVRAGCGHAWLRRQVRGELPSPRGVACRLCLVRGMLSPVVTGWRRACIWLPEEAAAWPVAKLHAVCLHEMAHYQRRDAAWLWLGFAVAAVWWWQPLAWLALRQMTTEAELSADEAALAADVTAPDYAQVLVEIASGASSPAPAAGIPMLGRSGIERRVRAILSGTGCGGLFGTKARLALAALAALAAAGVVAAGVEARHPMQQARAATPLSTEELVLVDRCLATLEAQAKHLNLVHLKMTQSWEETGTETVRSPQPSIIEAWVDHAGRKFRDEKRPEVSRWRNGAAPWSIENRTTASDGQRTWYQRGDDEQPHFFKETMRMMFAPWEGAHAEQLVRTLRQIRETGLSNNERQRQTLHVLDADHLELRSAADRHHSVWTVDLAAGGIAAFRQTYPQDHSASSMHWQVREWASLPDGTMYPARWESGTHNSATQTVYVNTITFLETLSAIPPGLLTPPLPQDVDSIYVARDGSTAHEPTLEVRFIHAKNGKPVPKVTVHYDLNEAKRAEVKSDAEGVAHIPLPEGEVKYLRLWGLKPGFVMQTVLWRRAGDPLKLPASYTTKLMPDAGPISGQVMDGDGKPVPGAKVQVLHRGGRDSWNVFADMHDHGKSRTVTDADGRWSLHNFAADLSGLIFWVEHPRYKRVATGYQAATGQPFSSLRDGTSRVVLHSAGIELSGRVTDAAGKPVPECKVTLGRDRWGSKDEPEALTDTAGRFTVFVHEPGTVDMTFEAAGLQPQLLQVAAAGKPAGPMKVVLQPGAGLRLRVVDEAGKPVAKAEMIPDRWREKRTLWHEGRTDADGIMVWEGAPADAVLWTVLGPKQILRDVAITPSGTEQTVVLRPATRFSGTVADARTGQPVPLFRVTLGDTRRSTGKFPAGDIYWQTPEARSFRAGAFTMEAWEMRFDHALLIEADGYEPLQTASYPSHQQDETLALKLARKK